MEALNEVYFGREAVLPLQKQITKFRDKLANKPVTSTTNLDPELIKFNRLAESFFGFNTFAIYIYPDPLPNAYAMPVDMYMSDEEREKILNSLTVNPTSGQFQYRNAFGNISLIIAIHSGVLDNPDFTDEEIMATILHEIGHGFFEAVVDHNCEFSVARKMTALLSKVNSLALDKVKHGKYVTKKIINKEFSDLNGFVHDIKSKLHRLKGKVFGESMVDNMKKNRIDYTNEKFADTFAAMFGYGLECHSFDIKTMNYIYKVAGVKPKKYPRIIEILKSYKLYVNDAIDYIMNSQDEHPEELARIKTTVDYIKRELSKEALDPKIKQELTVELEKINKMIQEYIKFPKDEDSMRILRLYYVKLYEKFGGDRREQDTDNDALFAAIDSRYKELGGK